MPATQLIISNDTVAWEYIKSALEGHYDDEVVELKFEDWPNFSINVTGQRYNSTVTTSMMRSLVELQVHLHRVYAEIIYGKSARSLTLDERNALEIVYKVKEGSSDVSGSFGGFFTELGKGAMDKMTGAQVVMVVAGVAALIAGTSMYGQHLAADAASKRADHQHEINMELLKAQPRLQEIHNEQQATYLNILKSVLDADTVVLDRAEYNSEQLAELAKQEKVLINSERVDDQYLVTSLKLRDDGYRIDLVNNSTKAALSADLPKNQLGADDMDRLFIAFTSETTIGLKVSARMRGDVITSSNILGLTPAKRQKTTTGTPAK